MKTFTTEFKKALAERNIPANGAIISTIVDVWKHTDKTPSCFYSGSYYDKLVADGIMNMTYEHACGMVEDDLYFNGLDFIDISKDELIDCYNARGDFYDDEYNCVKEYEDMDNVAQEWYDELIEDYIKKDIAADNMDYTYPLNEEVVTYLNEVAKIIRAEESELHYMESDLRMYDGDEVKEMYGSVDKAYDELFSILKENGVVPKDEADKERMKGIMANAEYDNVILGLYGCIGYLDWNEVKCELLGIINVERVIEKIEELDY